MIVLGSTMVDFSFAWFIKLHKTNYYEYYRNASGNSPPAPWFQRLMVLDCVWTSLKRFDLVILRLVWRQFWGQAEPNLGFF